MRVQSSIGYLESQDSIIYVPPRNLQTCFQNMQTSNNTIRCSLPFPPPRNIQTCFQTSRRNTITIPKIIITQNRAPLFSTSKQRSYYNTCNIVEQRQQCHHHHDHHYLLALPNTRRVSGIQKRRSCWNWQGQVRFLNWDI
jgi:hypothetical protein